MTQGAWIFVIKYFQLLTLFNQTFAIESLNVSAVRALSFLSAFITHCNPAVIMLLESYFSTSFSDEGTRSSRTKTGSQLSVVL